MKGEDRLVRKSKSVLQKRSVEVLVMEGASEKIYFDKMSKRSDVTIRSIDCHGGDLKKIKHRCEVESSKLRQGDSLCVVMDVDNTPSSDIRGFISWCGEKNISVYLSNPSFEVFLLMHYTDVSPQYDQHDLEDSISRFLGRKYEKARGITTTDSMVKDAVRRSAKSVSVDGCIADYCLDHPGSTMLHLLVKKLQPGFGD